MDKNHRTWDAAIIVDLDLTLTEVSNLMRNREINWNITTEIRTSFIEIRGYVSEIADRIDKEERKGSEYQQTCINLTFSLPDLIDLIRKNMTTIVLVGTYIQSQIEIT